MLRKEISDAIIEFDRFVMHNLTLEIDEKTYSFGNDICPKLVLCPLSNAIVPIFFESYWSEKVWVAYYLTFF